MGVDYYKDPLYATPLAFDIVTEGELQSSTQASSKEIKNGNLSVLFLIISVSFTISVGIRVKKLFLSFSFLVLNSKFFSITY